MRAPRTLVLFAFVALAVACAGDRYDLDPRIDALASRIAAEAGAGEVDLDALARDGYTDDDLERAADVLEQAGATMLPGRIVALRSRRMITLADVGGGDGLAALLRGHLDEQHRHGKIGEEHHAAPVVVVAADAGSAPDAGSDAAPDAGSDAAPDAGADAVPADALLTDAPAPSDAPDAPKKCTVTGVTVVRDGGYEHDAQGFSFTVKITVKGTNLDLCEIRQMVNVQEKDWDFDGTATKDATIRESYDEDLRGCVNTAEWCVDTGWDWQAIPADGKMEDNQVHNCAQREAAGGGEDIHRNETTRKFKIEIRRKGTTEILHTHKWNYSWSNWPEARVAGKPYANTTVDVGRFYDLTGCDLSPMKTRP